MDKAEVLKEWLLKMQTHHSKSSNISDKLYADGLSRLLVILELNKGVTAGLEVCLSTYINKLRIRCGVLTMVSEDEKKVINKLIDDNIGKFGTQERIFAEGLAKTAAPMLHLITKAKEVDEKLARFVARNIILVTALHYCKNIDDGMTLLKECEKFIEKADKSFTENM